jgi:hypothetical protein
MMDPRQALTDALVRPIAGGGGLEAEVRGEIMERLAHARPAAADDTPGEMLARLEARERRPVGQCRWAVALLALLALGLAWRCVATWTEVGRLGVSCPLPLPGRFVPLDERVGSHLDAATRAFLVANLTHGSPARVAEDFPPDPAAAAEHVAAHFYRRGVQAFEPGAILSHGRRVDPGNALWGLMEMQGRDEPRSWGSAGIPTTSLRRPEFRAVMALMREAAAEPEYRDWTVERTRERLALLPPVRTLADQVERRDFAIHQRSPFGKTPPALHPMWAAGARAMARDGDREGLRTWLVAWKRVFRVSMLDQPRDLAWGLPVARVIGELHRAARELGMDVEREEILRVRRALEVSGGQSEIVPRIVAQGAFALPREAMEQARRAELAVLERLVVTGAAAVFGLLALLAAFEGWRRPARVCTLAAGVMKCIHARDFLVIYLGAGLLPVAWLVGVTRFSPWSMRDAPAPAAEWLVAVVQVAAAATMALCLAVQVAKSRIGRRCGALALRSGPYWPGWVAAFWAAAMVPAAVWIRPGALPQAAWVGPLWAAMALPWLWLVWVAGAWFLRPVAAALDSAVAGRVLFPVMILVAATWGLALPLPLAIQERRAVARDPVGTVDAWGLLPPDAARHREIQAALRKAADWGDP